MKWGISAMKELNLLFTTRLYGATPRSEDEMPGFELVAALLLGLCTCSGVSLNCSKPVGGTTAWYGYVRFEKQVWEIVLSWHPRGSANSKDYVWGLEVSPKIGFMQWVLSRSPSDSTAMQLYDRVLFVLKSTEIGGENIQEFEDEGSYNAKVDSLGE